MRAGRKRTPLSWQSYAPERDDERDAREGLWPRTKLEAMDRKFVERVERAIRSGAEHYPQGSILLDRCTGKTWLLLCIRNDTAGCAFDGLPLPEHSGVRAVAISGVLKSLPSVAGHSWLAPYMPRLRYYARG